jgi:hypothetical protein
MSSSKPQNEAKTPVRKIGIRVDKNGTPYADMREVIESELARIRRKQARLRFINGQRSEEDDQDEHIAAN